MFRSVKEFEEAGDLTPAEIKLIAAVRAGRVCWLCDPKSPVRPTAPAPENRLRAELLRVLITGGTAKCGLHESGVAVFGGWIDGSLDLAYCHARGETQLDFCHFVEPPSFYNAHFQQFSLNGSQFPGILAQGAVIEAGVFLRNSSSTGMIELDSAEIGGQLACENGNFLGGTNSEGDLEPSIKAQALKCKGLVSFKDIRALGQIQLAGASLGDQLIFRKAILNGGQDRDGEQIGSLFAQNMSSEGSVFLNGLKATGSVNFNGAEIGGGVELNDTTLDSKKQNALTFDLATVAGRFFVRHLIVKSGRVDLTGMKVGELHDMRHGWPQGKDRLRLDGFTYSRITSPSPRTLSERADWLRDGSTMGDNFTPQPYTQFARVLREQGDAAEARKVLIERERLLAAHRLKRDKAAYAQALAGGPDEKGDAGRIWIRMRGAQAWAWLTRVVTGYGYAPERALHLSLGITGLATLLFMLFWWLGAMVPARAVILTSAEWAEAFAEDPRAPALVWPPDEEKWPAASHYETFYALPYVLDVYLPLVDLGQQSAWSATTLTWAGWWARLAAWALQALGFIVTTLGLAAATGIIQRNNPD